MNSLRPTQAIFALLTFYAGIFLSIYSYAQPEHLWSRSFGGTHPDKVLDMCYDPSGNLYATGSIQGALVLSSEGDTLHTTGAVGNLDIYLNKFAPDGTLLWSRVWGGSSADEGKALSSDAEGNIYLTGIFEGSVNFGTAATPIILQTKGWGSDAFLLKINPEGIVLWAKGLGGNFSGTGSGVTALGDGSVVMCGRFIDSLFISPPDPNFIPQAGSDGNRVYLAKFGSGGDFIWIKRFGGSAGLAPKSLKSDQAGNLILAGDFIGTIILDAGNSNATFTSQGSDIYIAKYSGAGTLQWARFIGGSGWEFVHGLDIFSNGDIAIAGSFNTTLSFGAAPGEHQVTNVNDSDVYVARISAGGITLWAHSAGSTGSDEGLALAIDGANQVNISGVFRQTMSFSNAGPDVSIQATGLFQIDGFLAVYQSDGTFVWAGAFECPSTSQGTALAAHGNVLATGGRFAGSVKTDFSSVQPTLNSLFNGTSMDVFIATYAVKDESGTVCMAHGGTLEAPSNRSFCVGTGTPKSIAVTAIGASGALQRWALIDNVGNIVATRASNSLFNLDAFPPGNYSIRHIRYETNVTNLNTISHVSQINQLNGCFAVSANAIQLFLREQPNGGVLSPSAPMEVCAGGGAQSVIAFTVSGNVGEFSAFGLLAQGPGQVIIASNTTGIFDFNALPPGNYLLAHLSYQQGVNVSGLSSATQLQGCYAVSNTVPVSVLPCGNATLHALPNPTESMSLIQFSSPHITYTTLEVYDMSGRLISRLWEGLTDGETNYYQHFDASGLPNGIYIIRMSNSSKVLVHKLMVAK